MHLYGAAGSKPINSYDVELVAAPGESFDNYCKEHYGCASGEYSYTHVWQPASVGRQRPTELATAAGPAARHCCRRDHVYESPTFDENGVERCRRALNVLPPYYYHEDCLQSRPPRTVTTTDEYHHQQQQVEEEEEEEDEAGRGSDESVGVVAGEWYQPTRSRFEPVVCSSDTPRPRTDNHYT